MAMLSLQGRIVAISTNELNRKTGETFTVAYATDGKSKPVGIYPEDMRAQNELVRLAESGELVEFDVTGSWSKNFNDNYRVSANTVVVESAPLASVKK